MPAVHSNAASTSALLYLNSSTVQQSAQLAKLASGSNIQKASADAAGSAIQNDGATLSQGAVQFNNASSALQVADGATSKISDLVQRMRSLAVQSANGTGTIAEKAYLNKEFDSLNGDITSIVSSTKFNDRTVLDGSFKQSVSTAGGNTVDVAVGNYSTEALGTDKLSIDSKENAEAAVSALDNAVSQISTGRANIGSAISRLQFQSDTTAAGKDGAASASKIVESDMNQRIAEPEKGNVQSQATVAALYQANSTPQAMLSLLR